MQHTHPHHLHHPHHTAPTVASALLAIVGVLLVGVAMATTAVAVISVTILPPATQMQVLSVIPNSIDVPDRTSAAVSVVNNSSAWQSVRIELTNDVPGSLCDLHYSPVVANIPPRGSQVVRVLNRSENRQLCHNGYALRIYDGEPGPDQRFVEVPVNTALD